MLKLLFHGESNCQPWRWEIGGTCRPVYFKKLTTFSKQCSFCTFRFVSIQTGLDYSYFDSYQSSPECCAVPVPADDQETNVLKVNTSKHGLHFTFCYFVLKYSVGRVCFSTQLIITLLQMFVVFPLLIYSNCKGLCFQFSTLAQWNPPLKNTTNTQKGVPRYPAKWV